MDVLKIADGLFDLTEKERTDIYDKFVIEFIDEMIRVDGNIEMTFWKLDDLIEISIIDEQYEATEFLMQIKERLEKIYV
jgi:hypothetical protein